MIPSIKLNKVYKHLSFNVVNGGTWKKKLQLWPEAVSSNLL